jgi:hypothetical protein
VIAKRTDVLEYMSLNYKGMLEMSRDWVLSLTENSILQIATIKDKIPVGKQKFFKGRKRVPVKMINEIHNHTWNVLNSLIGQQLPFQLHEWTKRLTEPGTYLLMQYVMKYEKARLNFDGTGALINQTEDK